MGKRARFWFLVVLVVLVLIGNAACTGTPPLFHKVSLAPSGTVTVGSGQMLPISASVANDTSAAGVTWTPPAHGTLTAVTTTSVVYNAPVVAAGASVSDTVEATSVTFANQMASLSITVEGAPVITTASPLPDGNFGSPYTATISEVGGVPPFAWSVSAGSLTTGLSLTASTTNSVMVTGTPGAQVDSNFTIQVMDSTGAIGIAPMVIHIGAPLPLQVTTTALPNGVLNAAYPSTTLQASGGVPPFTWSPTPAPAGFPPGLSLAADGTITGVPTVTGTFNFSVLVADSEIPAMTAPANLSITVNNLGALSGNYAFEFSGFNSTGGVVMAGSFTADGAGNISNGVEDFNTQQGPPKNQTFTGTYTLGADNRGQLIFGSLAGSPTFAFAIDSTGSNGRLIEFDGSGIRGSGQLEKQTVSTCAFNTINGNYAFGLTGQEIAFDGFAAGPSVIVGSFLASAPGSPSGQGSIGPGEDDANTPGGITSQDQILSGTFQTTSQSARCTMTLSPSVFSSGLTFSVYPVSGSEAFLVETDTVSATGVPFLTAGKMLTQFEFGGPEGTTFTATGSVAGMTGEFPTGTAYVPDLMLISLVGSGTSSYTISIVENQAGTVIQYNTDTFNFITADQYGRVDSGLSTPIALIFYTVNQNEAFAIGETSNGNNNIPIPFSGIFEPQSMGTDASFSASTIAGTLVSGTSAPTIASVPDISGTVTLASTSTTAGTINGTQDQSVSVTPFNLPAQTVTGTFSGLTPITGTGTIALTAPTTFTGDFLIVSPTKVLVMSTTAGDVTPVMIFLGDCAATCGEN
jgi:hypothetical protein